MSGVQLLGWREISRQNIWKLNSLALNVMVQDNDVFSRQKKKKGEGEMGY